MARDYGFGIMTNIELPGEIKGVLKKPVDWSATTLNTIAFGYEVGVTPLQIAAAYGALANGGMLMKPFILKKIVDASGQILRATQPQQIRRVISPSTAQVLTKILEGVVERGTGKPAQIEGVTVAGKTGTSRKYIEGHYEMGSYTASFVGFFPADDPQMVCLVMLDNPRGANYTGGTTSAPVFRNIAQRALSTSELFAKPYNGSNIIAHALPKNTQQNTENPVTQGTLTTTNKLTTKSDVKKSRGRTIPDLKGYSVRRAVSFLMIEKYVPVVNGSGTVLTQIPAAGQPAAEGMRVTLFCQPKSLTTSSANLR